MADNRKERRARQHLFKHLPEALGYAHALNDILALDLHTMIESAKEAGFPTFKALDLAMIKHRPAIIIARDRCERLAIRDRIATFRRAIRMYGYGGTAVPMLLVQISNDMPPAEWHFRVALDENGCVEDADAERHVAAPGATCNSSPQRDLH